MTEIGKIYVIGDIHGCYWALISLLDRINPDPDKDNLIFLGDYIDRGPESKEVISELISLRHDFPCMITLMGNHEQTLLSFLKGHDQEFYLEVGGCETLASYGLENFTPEEAKAAIPEEHMAFIRNLLPYWEDDQFIYVHAGLQSGVSLSQQSKDWLFWANSNQVLSSDYNFDKVVIFGHIAMSTPLVLKDKIGVDTSAVFGGKLSCLVLPDKKFISVPGPGSGNHT